MVVGADLAGQLDDPADYGAGIPYGPSRKNPAFWFAPRYVMADRGYDSEKNHRVVEKYGAIPIIAIRKTPGNKPREGIYVKGGAPSCLGMVEMEYVRSDPEKGHLYRCRREGCHLNPNPPKV